ncbi:hypothetical protein BJV82DRAFT_596084 [Fennellomyces sp. T-0311]|nr:hypothetical protein BJV82DRAFT_596084 [Fennellomyces sp. T-0311]
MFFGSNNNLTAAIIGAGFSGICAAIELEKKLGTKAQLFELSEDVGGTWHDNIYPGLECDIPSHLYSLPSELNANWTKYYSGRAEIWQYMREVAKKHHIYEQTKFETEVVRSEWMDDKHQWHLEWRNVKDHQQVGSGDYDILFAGVGPLRIPVIPPEFSNFSGTVVHTARWDPNIDYTDKRVAVVGNGATAAQLVPELRKMAGHLYCYQRTPCWVVARDQFAYSKFFLFLFQWIPLFMRLYRFFIYLQCEMEFLSFGKPHSAMGRKAHQFLKGQMESRLSRVDRTDLIPVLVPEYLPGCKRIAKSEYYLEALAESNVTVIPSGVSSISGRTLTDKDGNETEVDILVLATGYDVLGFTGNLGIYGRNKVLLDEKWRKNFPKTYKTVTVHGFPNFFILLGPSTILGHNSVVSMMAIQVDYAIKCIRLMKKKAWVAIEPKESAQEKFSADLQEKFKGTVWTTGCRSWYMNEVGQIWGLWCGTVTAFWWLLLSPVPNDFNGYKSIASMETQEWKYPRSL